MSPSNGLVCFTNCLLPLEDGSLVEKDLWIDERQGTILDAQVSLVGRAIQLWLISDVENILHSTGTPRQDH